MSDGVFTVGTRYWWWITPQDQRGGPSKGVGEECVSSKREPWAISVHHWWHESGLKGEREWADLLAAGRISLVTCPLCSKSHLIDVVFDVYKKVSIKDAERANRGADTGIRFKNIAPRHKIQHWRKLLPTKQPSFHRHNRGQQVSISDLLR